MHDLSFFALPGRLHLARGPAPAPQRSRATVRASARVLRSRSSRGASSRPASPRRPRASVDVPHGADDDLRRRPTATEARARLGARGPLRAHRRHRVRPPPAARPAARDRARCGAAIRGLRLEVVGDLRTHPPLERARARGAASASRAAVRFTGFVSEAGLADRYAAADVAVFLSEYEGFGLPALEAMARGVPVVVSDRPALGRGLRRGRDRGAARGRGGAREMRSRRVLEDERAARATSSRAAGPSRRAIPGRRRRASRARCSRPPRARARDAARLRRGRLVRDAGRPRGLPGFARRARRTRPRDRSSWTTPAPTARPTWSRANVTARLVRNAREPGLRRAPATGRARQRTAPTCCSSTATRPLTPGAL